MDYIKKCKCCGKDIAFYSKSINDYLYKDCLGYYCSYNCYRKKSMLKDNLINCSCLGEKKEKRIIELTYKYFMDSGDTILGISNYKAIIKICSKKELEILLKENKTKTYFEKLKNLKEKRKDDSTLYLGK